MLHKKKRKEKSTEKKNDYYVIQSNTCFLAFLANTDESTLRREKQPDG